MMSDRPRDLEETIDTLFALRESLIELASKHAARISEMPVETRQSARNLLHYVGLRGHDLRQLQERLVHLGASSLGRCEPAVLISVQRVIELLCHLSNRPAPGDLSAEQVVSSTFGPQALIKRAEVLFGPAPTERSVRIMVTMPTEAATDPDYIERLMLAGMDCVRINCAHDDATVWHQIIDNLRRAEERVGRKCRVLMDLGGPKLRTGPIETSPPVTKWQPQRDEFGRVRQAARLLLIPPGEHVAHGNADTVLPVTRGLLDSLQIGDHVQCRDTRGRLRMLHVVERQGSVLLAECDRTGYVAPGTKLQRREPSSSTEEQFVEGQIELFPGKIRPIELMMGDTLLLAFDAAIGSHAKYDDRGNLIAPPRIGCTLPDVVRQLMVGERVLFDDGKIVAIVREFQDDGARLEIISPSWGSAKLRPDKGINFPDSSLELRPLTDKDLVDLDFVVRYADMVGYSFVRSPRDVTHLQAELAKRGGEDLGVVLKIENRQAFERLPALLLAAMRSRIAGVIIARGDLAVECGYERLAEVQEEILWICEAAHLPVVWATQVLEHLAKTGSPSRAEITDAAMSVRAECVMLNKGPHIRDAVRMLDDILGRMQMHQTKKRSLFRRLQVAQFAASDTLFD